MVGIRTFWVLSSALLTLTAWAQDSLHVRRLAQLDLQGDIRGVSLSDSLAFVFALTGGMYIVDVSDSTQPQLRSNYSPSGSISGGTAVGNVAYVARMENGMRIVDVSNPASPQALGSVNTPGQAYSVVVSGDNAFIADYDHGIRIVRISNPNGPYEIGYYDTPGYARDLAVRGNYVYAADGTQGLRVIDVTNPSLPQEVGSLNTPGTATAVAVHDSLAFVADVLRGVRIINISDPANPYEVGYCATTLAMDVEVAVTDSFAFIADEENGLRVFSIANPTAPVLVGYYNTPGEAYGVAARGNLCYVADDSYFSIYDVSAAVSAIGEIPEPVSREYAMLRAYPNPFNSTTMLQLELPQVVRGRLALYDLAGRTVRILDEGTFPSGKKTVSVDGHALASGVYIARLESDHLSAVQKIHLIR